MHADMGATGNGGLDGSFTDPDAQAVDLGTTVDLGVEADLGVEVDAGVDSGPADAGEIDLGVADLGAPDFGPVDLGAPDLGAADLGVVSMDMAVSMDMSVAMDSGPADAGVDFGPPDLGPPDMGPPRMSCVTKIWGDHFLRGENGYLYHYSGGAPQPIVNDNTALPLLGIVDVVEYQWYACGLRNDHTVWCWTKSNGVQVGGGIGVGDPTHVFPTAFSAMQVQLDPMGGSTQYLTDAVALASGQGLFYMSPTCVIRSDSSLWCWGPGTEGDLNQTGPLPGYPFGGDTGYPHPVWASMGVPTTNVASASVGNRHACFVTTAGAVKCWGDDTGCELGLGASAPNSRYPMQIMHQPSASVTQVSCGEDLTCVVAGGEVYCMGSAWSGQIGVQPSPTMICGANYSQIYGVLPVEIATSTPLTNVADIHVGYGAVCARTSDNALWCWGGSAGTRATQLGYNGQAVTDMNVAATNIDQYTSFGTSGIQSMSSLTADGTYWHDAANRSVDACPPL